ncbi:MAG: transposase [Armatimonadetes bacterium]|nr:transposase [Armatimonadota bacterium]
MANGLLEHLTSLARAFLEPKNASHRQYEALRAYFVDGLPSAEAAERFGYTPGSFRVLCHKFRQDPERAFFLSPKKGPRPSSPTETDPERERISALRKQNLSVYDISEALEAEGWRRSPASVATILKEEGFAPLPRRRDNERPARVRPEVAEVADVRELDLSPRRFRTQFGGLFLFVPYLARIPFEELLERAGFPGSAMVPAAQAMRSLLALKLFGNARLSHVMSYVFDEGLAAFAGLNVMPKRAFLTEYSCRIDPRAYPELMGAWFDAMNRLGLEWGPSASFDLDFHTIPFHGEDALVEKHYVSKRSRSQKGVLAFLAQDAETRVFCYAHGELRRDDRDDEVLRFVEYWKERTGHWPTEVVFDSKLTTYRILNQLNQRGIDFITLRRRSKKMLADVAQGPPSAWRRIRLDRVPRAYRTPRVLDQRVPLRHYEGPCRQLVVADLGHENPTFLLTNQMRRSPAKLVGRYAQRMVIENGIADGIDFFHMDALSSAVPMKVNCDLQLTLMASSLYRLLGTHIGNGYATAKSRHIFRDFVDAVAHVTLTDDEVIVRFQKRAHNPLLLAAGFADLHPPVPWLGHRRLRLLFG